MSSFSLYNTKSTLYNSFSNTEYQQYEDKTPLKVYSKLDHHDKKTIELYHKMHPKTTKNTPRVGLPRNSYGEIIYICVCVSNSIGL